MINGIQLMVYTSLFRINLPFNVQKFYSLLIEITMFDLLPSENIGIYIFNLTTKSFHLND